MTLLAYLDPGTGSFILQVLVGGAFGSMLVLKHFWRQVKHVLVCTPQPPVRPADELPAPR